MSFLIKEIMMEKEEIKFKRSIPATSVKGTLYFSEALAMLSAILKKR